MRAGRVAKTNGLDRTFAGVVSHQLFCFAACRQLQSQYNAPVVSNTVLQNIAPLLQLVARFCLLRCIAYPRKEGSWLWALFKGPNTGTSAARQLDYRRRD